MEIKQAYVSNQFQIICYLCNDKVLLITDHIFNSLLIIACKLLANSEKMKKARRSEPLQLIDNQVPQAGLEPALALLQTGF